MELFSIRIQRTFQLVSTVIDNFGQVQQLTLSFNNDNGKDEEPE